MFNDNISWDERSCLILFGVVLLVSLHFLAEPLRWVIYTRTEKKTRLVSLFEVFFATSLASYLLPFKLGVPLRFFLLRKHRALKPGTIVFLMTTDQVLGFAVWFGICVLFAPWVSELIHFNALDVPNWLPWMFGILFCFLVFFILVIRSAKLLRKKDFLFKKPISRRRIVLSGLVFVVDVLSYALRHILILKLLGVDQVDMLIMAGISVISVFAGMLSGLPMGLGGYDATIVLLLTAAGTSVETALLVPLINRALNFLIAALIGVPSALRIGGFGVIREIRQNRLDLETGRSGG